MNLGNLNKRFERFCFKNRDKGIPNLMLYIVLGNALVLIMSMVNGGSFLYSLLCFDKNMILHADFTATGAAQIMEEFLQKNIPFDAVFSNDEMALGVHRTLLSKNISIPSDVSLAGCDNLPLGQMLYPALSTVDLDYGVLADEAIKFILQSEKVFKPCRRLIQPRLLIRESTKVGNKI